MRYEIVFTRGAAESLQRMDVNTRAEEDRQDYQLENDPRFLQMIAESRQEIQEGRGIRLEDIELKD